MSAEVAAAGAVARRFFSLESVAIVGASERQHHTGAILAALEANGIGRERVFLVSKTNDVVHGIATHRSLGDLGVRPSLVACLVPAVHVSGVLKEAGALGVPAFMSIADGFADSGEEGRRLQAELVALAGELDVALLGPNTLGYLAPGRVGAWVGDWSAAGVPPLSPGSVSIVAQSSGILNLIFLLAAHRRLGLRAGVSVGNEACVDAADFLAHFAEDEGTSVIGLVLESTTRPRALARALAAARRRGKRVLVFKFGSSELGRRNALSHSGRLASGGRVWEALFDKIGAATVGDYDEFVDGLALAARFAATGAPLSGDLGFLTVSGGDVGLVSDLCEAHGVALATLSPATRERLLSVEGNITHAESNPVDLGLIGHRMDVLTGIAEGVFAEPAVGYAAARLALPWRFSERAGAPYAALHERALAADKPFFVITRAAEPLEPAWYEYFAGLGLPLLTAYGTGFRTLSAVLSLFRRHGHVEGWDAEGLPERVEADAGGEELLSFSATQARISALGVPHVRTGSADLPAEALALAEEIGYPVCVKGLVPGLVHKAAAGLVRVGLADAAALEAAIADLSRTPAAAGGLAYEVQAMLGVELECIVGMVRDPIMGPVLTIGAGGTGVEGLGDVAFLLPPVTPGEVLEACGRLRMAAALFDDAVVSPDQRARFADLVTRFAAGVVADPTLRQVDLNPVVFGTDGEVLAVDAVVAVGRGDGGRERG